MYWRCGFWLDAGAGGGVWGFTIGAAIFDGKLPGEKDVVSQVRTALSYADAAAGARV